MSNQRDSPGSSRNFRFVNPNIPETAYMSVMDKNAEEYNFQHRERGIVLIFNHEQYNSNLLGLKPRLGTKHDVQSLKRTLETKLEFTVHIYYDLPKAGIYDVLKYFSGKVEHSHYDCFMLVCLTHGRRKDKDYLYAFDQDYKAEDLWLPFLNNVCPTLANKPKLFFIQAGRGSLYDEGIAMKRMFRMAYPCQSVEYNIPKTSDLLVMNATTQGYETFLDSERGSPFIQTLCKQLDMNAFNDDLRSILTSVIREVSIRYRPKHAHDVHWDRQQCTPEISNDTLMRKIKFSPKTGGNT